MDSDRDEPDIEVDFEDFIGTVFYKPPLKKNTYSLTYTNNINELFEKLVRILKEGSRILFGHNDLDYIFYQLTESDFKKLGLYFESIGFRMNIKTCHTILVKKLEAFITNNTKVRIKERDIQSYKKIYPSCVNVKDLIDYTLIKTTYLKDRTLKIQSHDLYYFINFQHLE